MWPRQRFCQHRRWNRDCVQWISLRALVDGVRWSERQEHSVCIMGICESVMQVFINAVNEKKINRFLCL